MPPPTPNKISTGYLLGDAPTQQQQQQYMKTTILLDTTKFP